MLRAECEKYMDEFDAREAEKLKLEKEMFETPDDEGWVTVTKSNKMGASLESAAEKKKHYDQKMKKKLKDTLHMYSFQEREQKKESLATLKKKFQEDKDKIAKMKALRKFKPYWTLFKIISDIFKLTICSILNLLVFMFDLLGRTATGIWGPKTIKIIYCVLEHKFNSIYFKIKCALFV